MPRFVIVNAVYPPEPLVSAQIGRDLAVHLLAQHGAQVTVLCPAPSRPLGADHAALRPAAHPLVRIEEGVEVVRLPSFTAPRSRLLPRMAESCSFGRHVCRYLKNHLPGVDVVYANTWPLLSQTLIARYCRRQGIPLVWHIMDLYPESLMHRLPRCAAQLIAVPLTSLDRWVARQARHIVMPSDNLRRDYLNTRRLPAGKVTIVPNWIDGQQFERLPERAEACARYGVPDSRFTLLYLGNIGPVAGVQLLIASFHAARLMGAQLVIAGDGSSKAECVELARSLAAQEVRFISDPDAGNVPLLQSLGHVCLLPMRKGAAMSSVPSKLLSYLLSGRPVLATLDAESDAARYIRESGCGWVGEPENAAWLTAKMGEVAALPPLILDSMGHRGRAYGLKHFSKPEGVQRLADLVVAAGQPKRLPCRPVRPTLTNGLPGQSRIPNVVLVVAAYPPEPVVSAQMGRDLANHLVAAGVRVTVLCPYPTRPLGVDYADFPPSSAARVDDEGGVKVVRLPSFTSPHSRLVARMWESFSFGRHVYRYLEGQVGKADVVYANTWPLFSQELIAQHCLRRSVPLVLHVQDIYPEALETKVPRWIGSLGIPLLRIWDRGIAHRAAKVVTIAHGARSLYARTRSLPSERVEVVPNWQDEQYFLNNHPRRQTARDYAVEGAAFNFLYLGNIGPATDLELVIRAFAQASVPNGQLLIVGDGSAKQDCVALTRALRLNSVRFLPCRSPSDVPTLQSLAHVCLLPLKKGVALNGVPSKLAAYLFSAKPVLAALDAGSDTAQCIRQAQCGWVGEPEDLHWLTHKMAEVAALPPAALQEFGQRGRAYGLKHFSKAEGVRRLGDIVLQCVKRPSQTVCAHTSQATSRQARAGNHQSAVWREADCQHSSLGLNDD